MAVSAQSVTQICHDAKQAAHILAQQSSTAKDSALAAIADSLVVRSDEILAANATDLEAGAAIGLSSALLDRLALDRERIEQMAAGVRAIVALPDPVGEVIEGKRLPNGLQVKKVRVPLGVVGVIYEARPNVTIDAAALCLKSGNAVVLRGSSSAAHTNTVLAGVARGALASVGLPIAAVSFLHGANRDEIAELATQADSVDLVIPRGGEQLKAVLQQVATVPVIYAASGNCHIYVDRSADLKMAQEIIFNAKTQRPGVCNAVETVLIHKEVAEQLLADLAPTLIDAGVELRGDEGALSAASSLSTQIIPATEDDFRNEFLSLILALKVVSDLSSAIDHINEYGSGHSEAIITSDLDSAHQFELAVDAACVYVNASTRFTDGAEFGMGAEIGNSTQKLHARGPIGLRELCTFKYVIEGTGQVRT